MATEVAQSPAAPVQAVAQAVAPAVAGAPAVAQAQSSLYVGDLDRDVTEAQLFEVFSQVSACPLLRVARPELAPESA